MTSKQGSQGSGRHQQTGGQQQGQQQRGQMSQDDRRQESGRRGGDLPQQDRTSGKTSHMERDKAQLEREKAQKGKGSPA
jgi:hypothetical protein